MQGQRLTNSQISEVRNSQRAEQGNKCAICKRPLKASEIVVLDHDHSTGAIRGTLHHSCNALLGKVENNAGRFGVSGHLIEWCAGLAQYLMRHKTNVTGLIHPTYKTDDEKRLAKNLKTRQVRAVARKAKT
jgi:hypothetical protein